MDKDTIEEILELLADSVLYWSLFSCLCFALCSVGNFIEHMVGRQTGFRLAATRVSLVNVRTKQTWCSVLAIWEA